MKHFIAAFAAMLLLAAGCAHTSTLEWEKAAPGRVSSKGNPVVYDMRATNRGMYLFNCIPLWSGNMSGPNRHEYRLLQNKLTRADMRRMFEVHREKMGFDHVEDVEIKSSSSGAFSLWIVWRRNMSATAVAVKMASNLEKTEP
ncbi:MAG: hypothetical protein E7058_04145 [Lentisphaerae bacterium]|nr:hypothetical protein [Lentisphaerota bacterium]